MPKSKKRNRQNSATPAASGPKRKLSRRSLMANLALVGGGVIVLGGGGIAFGMDFRRKLAEGDLSRIGDGTPTIVQIHDPSCQLCQALQRETRAALSDCDEGFTYLVANITTADGAAFQRRMGQPHVTLALLDGDGTPVHFINGVTPAETLKDAFQTHLG